MAQVIGEVECPFCDNTIMMNSSPRDRRIHKCLRCKGVFFYCSTRGPKRQYFIPLKDIRKVKKRFLFKSRF